MKRDGSGGDPSAPGIPEQLTQQTQAIDPVFDQCWASVVDGGPTLIKHWANILCLLGQLTELSYWERVSCTLGQLVKSWTKIVGLTFVSVVNASVMITRMCGPAWVRIIVQATIYHRFRIGGDDHLDQFDACDIS